MLLKMRSYMLKNGNLWQITSEVWLLCFCCVLIIHFVFLGFFFFLSDMDRMVPGVAIWCLAIGIPLLGSLLTLTFFGRCSDEYKTKEWIWDDIISLCKGYTIVFFLCYGVASFISARISLPKPAAYAICKYSLSDQACTKVCLFFFLVCCCCLFLFFFFFNYFVVLLF